MEPQSGNSLEADKYKVPRICFINKMDRIGADFYRCVDMIVDRLGRVLWFCSFLLDQKSDFVGLVDLVEMKAIVWRDESLGAKFDIVEIPDNIRSKADDYRSQLLDIAVEADDDGYGNLP